MTSKISFGNVDSLQLRNGLGIFPPGKLFVKIQKFCFRKSGNTKRLSDLNLPKICCT